ncbi:MAG: cofactor-independent phosphoglycerate mutase [Deltaproteobacteria bacterium]|nr:cofactor-independent phosphoglycerate mutase [Deltaproteobacteria bacterium]
MKYVILLGDGMGDYPIDSLGGKTPLEAAKTPNMDWIAGHGEVGSTRTIPDGCEAGSDTANLSILGYNPQDVLSGRGPLEAASLGVKLAPADVAYRCNLVTLSIREGTFLMDDYSAGHISTEEARILIEDLDRKIGSDIFRFYPGVSYRHIMVWRDGKIDVDTTPPHDIIGRPVQEYLDRIKPHKRLLELMQQAALVLKDHPVNRKRIERGEKPANNVWFWGQGHPLTIPLFKEKTGLSGAMISAVDLLKGIGVYAGLDVIEVPGATGYLDTNYEGKADSCLEALKKVDFVYLHVEAPDEASHGGLLDEKIRAIEAFDERVVGRVLNGLKRFNDFRIMVVTDHYTPISVKTHTREPVPFAIYSTDGNRSGIPGGFNEKTANKGIHIKEGFRLIKRLISEQKTD